MIIQRAKESIANRSYISGKETRYYILTINLDRPNYQVKVLDNYEEIAATSIERGLGAAKKEGIRLLLKHLPTVDLDEMTMVHYKDDRPNGVVWQKDSYKVVKHLLEIERNSTAIHLNATFLDDSLRRFDAYRANHEKEYQANERGFKDEIAAEIGQIFVELNTKPQFAIDLLILLLSGSDDSGRTRKHLQRLFKGIVWVEDFLVFLRHAELPVICSFIGELFDEGITEAIRVSLSEHYQSLFNTGKFNDTKKKIESPVHLLAMLLASYSPDEYVWYKPDSFGPYVDKLGLIAPHDPVERYTLYNQTAHLVLERARKNGHNVQDLNDAYHVVYLAQQFAEETGGGLITMTASQPINKILYGPPGTGKTYNAIYEALSILDPSFDPDLQENPLRRDEAVELFNRHVDSNHITFCTFHQSFSYEEFVEGIRFSEEKKHYEVQDGVFKRLCNAARAVSAERRETYDFDPQKTQFFKMSLGNTNNIEEDEVYDYCISNNVIALGWGDDVDFSDCQDKQDIRDEYASQLPNDNSYGAEFVERFKHWMRVGDIVVISHGNKKARAIGKITSNYFYQSDTSISYYQFRSVQWLYEDNEAMLPVQSILREKVFSQQTIYMLKNSELNLESIQELIVGDLDDSGQEQQYVLIIDEINRGNISKIFGELITLIEADKRMGQRNELSVTLPYSGDRLRVPSNVHIIGTMNTADRSIALLDTALRRRFEFMEMLPDYTLLPTDVQGVNISLLLETINQRIAYLYDRDHVIGHAYFVMDKPDLEDYTAVMNNKIIPLLQEYFYDDWEQIELVLGGAGSFGDTSYFLNKETVQANLLFARGRTTSLEPHKTSYIVQPRPTLKAFKRVYDRMSNLVDSGIQV
ncbi:hypothetical protein FHS16_005137 [Paenibacillus endophyticus]|uniref:ATPase dynein-related AAA domain-containing protein n=1 Tax=Paenibacillus endophyticus TaxID=1294268 RepID=A0A7W5CC99_9BACL|nr:AAA family ATPase [Paenibacillus endophyticus]MBB3155030.1 hypothetical protein [Paenibacillus endophyticus]